jgi:hypothetical protein
MELQSLQPTAKRAGSIRIPSASRFPGYNGSFDRLDTPGLPPCPSVFDRLRDVSFHSSLLGETAIELCALICKLPFHITPWGATGQEITHELNSRETGSYSLPSCRTSTGCCPTMMLAYVPVLGIA